jgi:arabinose-5-phosphate isomerase
MSQKPQARTPASIIETACRTVELEAYGLSQLSMALEDGLGRDFEKAIEIIEKSQGRVIVSGMGKSGHIGRKIASTLASTGTPAMFLHAGEASHGDLGMVTEDDVIVALSWSGETAELKGIVTYATRFGIALISITSGANSTLAKASTIALCLPKCDEACPNGLAPTTSTTMQLTLGDALATTLLERRGFTPSDFQTFHPGGKLGANLKIVRDIMHIDKHLPLAPEATKMSDALVIMTDKAMGCLGITNNQGELIGVITDGDLRRHMSEDLLGRSAKDIMTTDPKTIGPDELASSALKVINSSAITSLFVVEDKKPKGIVHLHDLYRIGVV